MLTPAAIAHDPLHLAHRYDPGHDAFQFRQVSREDHRRATFLTDEYLGQAPLTAVRRDDLLAAAPATGPLHFIFHSAFCCSTVLARAFDLPGVSMGLKEPVVLNDLIGWQHRGGTAKQIAAVLDASLTLMARPFSPAEAVVVKPSNLANGLAPGILTMRPGSRALLLHAPLRVFLASIARKGMTGRLWARDLLVKQLQEGLHQFGFSGQDYLGQTDLQVAAMAWLAQHALFAKMVERFENQVLTGDSELIMDAPFAAMRRLAGFFALDLDDEAIGSIVAGPAFTRHSKSGEDFGVAGRKLEQQSGIEQHADEIEKVGVWAEVVAAGAGIPMRLPRSLLD